MMLRLVVAMSLALSVNGFVTVAPMMARGRTVTPYSATHLRTAPTPMMGMGSVIRPIKNFPKQVRAIISDLTQKKPPVSAKSEGAQLYRTLGVPPDADYGDVLAAAKRLKEKFKDDRKQQIKIDMVKDDIMALRLRQRMAGASTGNVAGAQADKFLDWERDQKRGWKAPAWAQGFLYVPSGWQECESYFIGYALLGVIGVLIPSAAQVVTMVAGMYTVSHIGSKGMPPLNRDESGMVTEYRIPGAFSLITALSFTTAACIFSTFLSNVIAVTVGVSPYLPMDAVTHLITTVLLLVLALFVTTYRHESAIVKGRGA